MSAMPERHQWEDGADYVSYAGASSGVAVSLTTHAWGGEGTGTAGDAAGDILERIEGLIGSSFNDTLGSTGGVAGSQEGYPEIPHTLVGGAGNAHLDAFDPDACGERGEPDQPGVW